MFAAFILLAPREVDLPPLFGKPQALVEKTLGRGKTVATGKTGGAAWQMVRYADLDAEYVNGRMRGATRVFPDSPDLDWADALDQSGYPSKDLKAQRTGPSWRIALPNDFEAVYTQRKLGTRIVEQSLQVRAPYFLVLAPPPAERKAIIDALRPRAEKAFHGQKVRFVVHMVAVTDAWAFLTVSPVAAAGGRLDLKNSDFAAVGKAAARDSGYALLQKVAGAWRPVETAFVPTDTAWENWAQKRGAPKIIFPDFAS